MHISARLVRGLGSVLVIAGLAHVAAQAKPDSSGEWVLNRQASTLPPPVSNVESGVVRNEHRDPSFSFRRTYVIGGTPRDASFTVRTDGSETGETGPQGTATMSTLRWDGAALVLAMRVKGQGFEATNDVRYDHDDVWIYDRREPRRA